MVQERFAAARWMATGMIGSSMWSCSMSRFTFLPMAERWLLVAIPPLASVR